MFLADRTAALRRHPAGVSVSGTATGRQNGELASRIRAVESGEAPPECSWFFDVLHLYDARSSLVHDGWLDRGPGGRDLSTWFIGAVLLRPLLTWFATNPSGDLCQLDNEISALAGTAGG
jgi:hypothetical protein